MEKQMANNFDKPVIEGVSGEDRWSSIGRVEERIQEKKKKAWCGRPPYRCDLCSKNIETRFVDGKTVHGPWAYMCEGCHEDFGIGLGTGKGQLYEKQDDNWFKIGG